MVNFIYVELQRFLWQDGSNIIYAEIIPDTRGAVGAGKSPPPPQTKNLLSNLVAVARESNGLTQSQMTQRGSGRRRDRCLDGSCIEYAVDASSSSATRSILASSAWSSQWKVRSESTVHACVYVKGNKMATLRGSDSLTQTCETITVRGTLSIARIVNNGDKTINPCDRDGEMALVLCQVEAVHLHFSIHAT